MRMFFFMCLKIEERKNSTKSNCGEPLSAKCLPTDGKKTAKSKGETKRAFAPNRDSLFWELAASRPSFR